LQEQKQEHKDKDQTHKDKDQMHKYKEQMHTRPDHRIRLNQPTLYKITNPCTLPNLSIKIPLNQLPKRHSRINQCPHSLFKTLSNLFRGQKANH